MAQSRLEVEEEEKSGSRRKHLVDEEDEKGLQKVEC